MNHLTNLQLDELEKLYLQALEGDEEFGAALVKFDDAKQALFEKAPQLIEMSREMNKKLSKLEAKFERFLRYECGRDKLHLWWRQDGTEDWNK